MSRFKLRPYEVQLREPREEFFDLNSLIESEETVDGTYFSPEYDFGTGFIDVFRDYCQNWYETPVNDQDRQRTLSVDDHPEEDDAPYLEVDEENNLIEGVFKYGVYGTEADHLDPEKGERELGRSADEAAETPVNFLLHIPERNPRKAVMVLQAASNVGAKSLVEQELRKSLPSELTYKMPPVKEEDIYGRIRTADQITRVKLTKSGRLTERNDTFRSVFSDDLLNQSVKYEPSQTGSIKVDVDELEDWLEADDEDGNPLNFEDETFDQVNLTIKEAGAENTIYLGNGEAKIIETLDDINTSGGHPVPSDVSKRTRSFINQEIPFAGDLSSSPLL